MADNEVTEQGAPETPVVPDKGQGKDKADDNVTITRAELESIRRESQERAEAAQYWSGLHRQGQGKAGEQEQEQDGSEFLESDGQDGLDGDTPEKLVDDLASKGTAGLKERGFITAKDAQKLAAAIAVKVSRELIGRERQKDNSDKTIMAEFPELKDQTSELFRETAKIYQAAVKMDPDAQKNPATLLLAAKAAKASMKPAPKPRTDDDDDYERPPEREEDRRRRTESQDGRTRGRVQVDERDDMLGDEARQVIKAMGITEEEYAASKKQLGITAGRGRRR